jgi:uncharacterized damage-inducible protein DinB
MVSVVKLLEYSQELRHRYLDTLAKLPWEEVVSDRGASFGSIRNIYLHMIGCVDGFVKSSIRGQFSFSRINYDDYDGIEKIRGYLERVESEVNEYLGTITEEKLSRKIEFKMRDGSTSTYTVEDWLVTLFEEETHHRGELIALLWQIDVDPPHMGWAQYITR